MAGVVGDLAQEAPLLKDQYGSAIGSTVNKSTTLKRKLSKKKAKKRKGSAIARAMRMDDVGDHEFRGP